MEPISPELVLISPELRQAALDAQPELPWEAALARARSHARAMPVAEIGRFHAAASVVGRLVQLALFVSIATGMITLALTLIANATATR
jgi:hypothetical protein